MLDLVLTPYPSVNTVLDHFATNLKTLLADQLFGLYLYGSLALGDFNPQTSDVDFIVITHTDLSPDQIDQLRQLHTAFAASDSPYAHNLEAAYTPRAALNNRFPTEAQYPQVEKENPFFLAPLEIGWPFQRHTLREHGRTILGSDLKTLIDPVDHADLVQSLTIILTGWQTQSQTDPSWLTWVNDPHAQAFVVLTLCRSLYFLKNGDLASKPASAHWAINHLQSHPAFPILIQHALTTQLFPDDLASTLSLLQYTVAQIHS
jgi:Domain of unknown function (DUF4111)/Nucleotidyltransferase domain